METLCERRAHQPWMEVFDGVEFAALRMWQSDTYLTADEDGRSVHHVSLRGVASHSAVWAVEKRLAAGTPPRRYLLFRGAYGRYLGAREDHEGCYAFCPLRTGSLVATQRDRDQEEVDAIMWRALACSGSDVFEHHDARGVVLLHDRSGRYLRGNKNLLGCRHSVSIDDNLNAERTLRWEVLPIPTLDRPELPFATNPDLAETLDRSASSTSGQRREIRYVKADDAGNFSEEEGDWTSFQFTSRSVQILREELANRVEYEVTLCVRAGRHGHLTPLLINLPRSEETLHIVVLRRNSAADEQLKFPNPYALLPDEPEEEVTLI